MWKKPKPDPQDAARGLRQLALTIDAAELQLRPSAVREQVWGILMETAYPEAVVTLSVLGDGSTSLYFSTGGGVIGAGEKAVVRTASEMFLAAAEGLTSAFTVADSTPMPEAGRVRFYLRTFNGTLGAEVSERDLREGEHELSPLFHAGHAVIAAIRESTSAQ